MRVPAVTLRDMADRRWSGPPPDRPVARSDRAAIPGRSRAPAPDRRHGVAGRNGFPETRHIHMEQGAV